MTPIRLALDALSQDLRYAVRTMKRAPGFTAIAAGSSAIAIGACSIIFAIVNTAILKPLAVEDPARLVTVSELDRRTAVGGGELSYPDFEDVRRARSFASVAAADYSVAASIGARGESERLWGGLVTANYFDVVKPRFTAGRGFDAAGDDTPGSPRVVVLSHDLWRRRFDGDPAIVGRSILINSRPVTVVGVVAADFRGTEAGVVPAFWIPFSMIDEHRAIASIAARVIANRQRHWLHVIASLRPDADVPGARAEMDLLASTLNSAHGVAATRGFHVEPAGRADPEFRIAAASVVGLSIGITALVLFTACVNVASLLLGRGTARRREIATRMAIGATRSRIVRQLLTESTLLALVGGAGGWAFAEAICGQFGVLRTPAGWPLDLTVTLDHRVLVFCTALSLATGLAFGLVPALRATHTERVAEPMRLRNALVAAQVATCTVLLVCTGLFVRSLRATQSADIGLRNRNLLLMSFDPGLDRRSTQQSRQLLADILGRAEGVPGVESATLTSSVPLTLVMSNSNFVSEERASDRTVPRVRTDIYTVGPDFLKTFGISLLAGSDLPATAPSERRVAMVNEAFARAAFPNQSPLGRRVVGDGKALEIIGVVATARSRTIVEVPRPAIYLPMLSEYVAAGMPRGVTLAVDANGSPMALAAPLRGAIRVLDPRLAVFDVKTMETHIGETLMAPRIASTVSAGAGIAGLTLAVVGLYSVLTFAVARRRREIGIRMAIGAPTAEILSMVLQHGAKLTAVGVAFGIVSAAIVARLIRRLLFGVAAVDPMTFGVVATVVALVALVACLIPARTAARLNPVEVLRTE